jgi:hypothetical protein
VKYFTVAIDILKVVTYDYWMAEMISFPESLS